MDKFLVLKGETKARRRMLQEVLFSYGYGWVYANKQVIDYPDNYIVLVKKEECLYNWGKNEIPSNNALKVSSEEFLANPEKYLNGVIFQNETN